MKENGTEAYHIGSLDRTTSKFLTFEGSCNGKVLILHSNDKYLFFDINSGKMLLDKNIETDDSYETLCFD